MSYRSGGHLINSGKAPLDKVSKTLLGVGILPKGVTLANLDKTAVVARRYAPVLSRSDAQLLALCKYEEPWTFATGATVRARKLVQWGLLERDGNTFRQTAAGRDVAERFVQLGWLERAK